MFRHHGAGSRRHHFALPGETTHRIELPPLWVGTVLAHQPPAGGQPTGQPTGTPPPPAAPPAWTPPASQADLDRIIEERLARDRAARPPAPPDLDDLRRKAEERDRLVQQHGTDQEKAVQAAEQAARDRASADTRNAVVRPWIAAELRAAAIAAGRTMTVEEATAMVAPLDPSYFVGANHLPDPAKVADYVAKLPGITTPPGDQGGQQQGGQQQGGQQQGAGGAPPLPSLGQGQQGGGQPMSAAEAGRARARQQFGDQLGPGRNPGHGATGAAGPGR